MKVVRLSTLCTGRLLPPETFLVLISVRGWVNLRAIVRPEEWCQWNILMTPSGIKPATFWFVAQGLNKTAPPNMFTRSQINVQDIRRYTTPATTCENLNNCRQILCFLVRASSYIPVSRPKDATYDRFLFSIYMCITLHVSSIKRSSSGIHRDSWWWALDARNI
jgi:hypothetical protein